MDRRGVDTLTWVMAIVIAGGLFLVGWMLITNSNDLFGWFTDVEIPAGDDETLDVSSTSYSLGCEVPGMDEKLVVCNKYDVRELCYVEIGAPCTSGLADRVSCGVYTCTPGADNTCTQTFIGQFTREHYTKWDTKLDPDMPACKKVK